ncbi:heavy metal-binding domain-containing protein [Lacibacter sp. H407]|uniref:heavy metal-binding domain-containing protein n=1 Tax=Lacibacter sp. H407 TaxID=3133423 RepID=UPI0030BDB2EE
MKTMKILMMAVCTILAFNAMAQDQEKKKQQTDKVTYSCPMHADVTSSKPGKCNKCGMDLVKMKKENMKTEVTKTYSCPMHAEVTSDKPGKCSKCGMDLVKSKEKTKTEVAKTYVCPMHADVTSDKPGKCSKCGMELKKKEHKH